MDNCGKLNKKITFCRQDDETFDDFSKTGKRLTEIRKVWASVKATTGNEAYEQQRLYNTVSYDIRTRYIPELNDPSLIILYKGERYEIRSVVDIGGKGTDLGFTCLKVMKE